MGFGCENNSCLWIILLLIIVCCCCGSSRSGRNGCGCGISNNDCCCD